MAKKQKAFKYAVIDTGPIPPVLVNTFQSSKDADALAATVESYVAFSLHARPKKKVKPPKPEKKSRRLNGPISYER